MSQQGEVSGLLVSRKEFYYRKYPLFYVRYERRFNVNIYWICCG